MKTNENERKVIVVARFAASNPMQRLEDIKNLPITAEGREGENWKKFQGGVILENKRLDDAKTQADNAFNAAQDGDFAEAGKLSSVQNYTLGTAGTTGTFNASGGFVQGGTQSGVSLSHNTQHNYSSGITASGGSLFAASATQMGFSADGFAAGASALSAVTQTAAFMTGPVGRGSMAAASALSSAASSGASATISRLNTMDRASRDFAHNQLASIGHIGMEGDMMRFSSALSQGRVLAQERSQGANGLMKRNKQDGLVISANKASGMGKAF